MKLNIHISILSCLIFFLFICGCLKDNITPPGDFVLKDSGRLLFYLEGNGDYVNSEEMPSLVDADEVFANLNTYLLLDIRPGAEFAEGHIEGAYNVRHTRLVAFLDSIDYKQYPEIIVISKNGQSSAYYTCLLRLYGFNNVYSMNYGMAAWHDDFADQWLGALQQSNDLLSFYSDAIEPKPPLSSLPTVSLSGSPLDQAVKNRLKEMIDVSYEDNLGNFEGIATIEYETFMNDLNNYFIVCYDQTLLYKEIRDNIYHPIGAVLYHPPSTSSDLKSTTTLQTLPSGRKIAFYSADGQLSAFAVAYLRVLGYDAKSVLFGANNMFYYLLLNSSSLGDQAFSVLKIKNYPYVTGN